MDQEALYFLSMESIYIAYPALSFECKISSLWVIHSASDIRFMSNYAPGMERCGRARVTWRGKMWQMEEACRAGFCMGLFCRGLFVRVGDMYIYRFIYKLIRWAYESMV